MSGPFTPGQVLTAAQLNAAIPTTIATATSPDAGALTGTEEVTASRGTGVLQTALTTIAQWVIQTYQGFTQSGTGAASLAAQAKLRQIVNLADFTGYDPTGSADSTAALVNACVSLGTNGGEVRWSGACLINSSFTIPPGVSLVGQCDSPGFQSAENYTSSYFESILIINASITVSMSSRSAVKRALVMSSVVSPVGAYPTPFGANASAAIAAFAGTAFTPLSNTSDNRLEDVLVIGFSAIYDGRGVTSNARPVFRRVLGDNTSGIFLSNVTDDGFAENCKLWPFTTVVEGQGNSALFLRSGTGFYSELVSQGMTWVNCGAFGYAVGHDVNAIRNIRQINCTVDGPTGNTSIGFQYRGAINNCINIGAEIAGQGGSGVLINTTPDGNSDSINLVGCNFHGSISANGYINIVAGNASVTACHFDGNASYGHVNLQSASTLYSESSCTHAGVGTGVPIYGNATAVAAAQVILPKNIGTFSNQALNSVSALQINDLTATGTSALLVEALNDSNGATIKIVGQGATTPSKTLRVSSGSFRIVNDGFTQDILTLTDAGALSVVSHLDGTPAGAGLRVKEGSNAKQGTATLSGGTVVVSNTSVTASSRIVLTAQDNNSVGALRVSARTAGTSFTVTSSSGTDSGVVAYEIFEPG
jgi:hypothetical protein